ncbi:MAG: glycosyltransferase [Ferrovibrio sp.]
MAYPRVLFVTGHAFNHVTGGGITFSNLFRGWPKDRIATVHHDEVPTSSDICDRYFVLGPAQMRLWWPLELLRCLRVVARSASALVAPPAQSQAEKAPQQKHVGWRRRLMRLALGDSMPDRWVLTPDLEAWIADYRPDVIYTLLGGNGMMGLLRDIRSRFGIPMVVHLMDDWPQTIYSRGLLARWERSLMQRLLREHLSKAALRFGISDAMCRKFAERYGLPFIPFQNVVELEKWAALFRSSAESKEPPYRLLYAGSIFPNAQLQSLLDMCGTVEALNKSGFSVTLEISSPEFLVAPWRRQLESSDGVSISPPIEDDATYFRHISNVDILLLPVNFDAASVTFIRYSMPTKVPAYLASGTPILVYGPRGVAQVDYALEWGWGEVVDHRDPAELASAIRTLLSNRERREALRRTAQEVARTRHDASRVRTGFQAALASVTPSDSGI